MPAFCAPPRAPKATKDDPIALGAAESIFSGSAWNFARHPAQQKKYSLPLCRVLKRAVAGFTSMPQTGSLSFSWDGTALPAGVLVSMSLVVESLSEI